MCQDPSDMETTPDLSDSPKSKRRRRAKESFLDSSVTWKTDSCDDGLFRWVVGSVHSPED